MSLYSVQKRFEQFHPGDELTLNARQAKYLLMSGHIAPVDAESPEINFIEETETDASQAKKKVKNGP